MSKLKEMYADYYDRKINWAQFAEFIVKEKSADPKAFSGKMRSAGMSKTTISCIIAAYNFIKVKRPDMIRDPGSITVSYITVIILPRLVNRVNDYEKMIDDVISGDVSRTDLQRIVREKAISGNKNVEANVDACKSTIEDEDTAEDAFVLMVKSIRILANGIIKDKESLDKVVRLGKVDCREAALVLNSISNPEFMEKYRMRKEFHI